MDQEINSNQNSSEDQIKSEAMEESSINLVVKKDNIEVENNSSQNQPEVLELTKYPSQLPLVSKIESDDVKPLMTSSPKTQHWVMNTFNPRILESLPIRTPLEALNTSNISNYTDESLNLSVGALKMDLSCDEDDDDDDIDDDDDDDGRSFAASSTNEISPGDNLSISDEGQSSKGSKSRRKSDRILPQAGDDGNERYTCPVCSEILLGNHDFTKHIRQHNTNGTIGLPAVNTCTICGKMLSSQSSLDRHMLVHSGERPFQCRVCHMAFTTNGNMHRHMRIHEKDFPQSGETVLDGIPIKESSPRPRAKKKINLLNEGDSPISLCMAENLSTGDGANRKRKPSESLSQSPRKQFRDKDGTVFVLNCQKIASTTSSPNSSPAASSGRIVLEPVDINLDAKVIKCPICADKFFSVYGLNNHLNTHDKYKRSRVLIRCSKCNLGWTNLLQYENHMKSVHKKVANEKKASEEMQPACSETKTVTEAKKSKEGKNQAANNPAGSNLDLLTLDFSSEKFPLIDKVYCEKNGKKSGADKSGSKVCKQCEQSFSCSASLSLHMIMHKTEISTACVQCERIFSSVRQAREHAIKHECDKIVDGFSSVEAADGKEEVSDMISQDEFLLVMGLKVTKHSTQTPIDPTRKKEGKLMEAVGTNTKFVQMDANQNFVPLASISPAKLLQKDSQGSHVGNLSRISPLMSKVSILPSGITSAMNLNSIFVNQAAEAAGSAFLQHKLAAVVGQASKQSLLLQGGSAVTDFKDFKGNEMFKISQESRILPPSGDGDEGDEGQGEGQGEDRGGPYICTICSEVFYNNRLFRGHLRTHAALSPFRCHQCSYASPDKSTLKRHLLTHNGERPFHCQICNFAFTTKANCERHVRKKHSIEDKEGLEAAILFQRKTEDSGMNGAKCGESLVSSSCETVCKYCGEDFKFIKALKHHIRSHSSCQHKPFLCKLCDVGFSTKANCLRHIQKQHAEIDSSSSPESHMQIKVELLEAQAKLEMEDSSESSIFVPTAHASLNPLDPLKLINYGSSLNLINPTPDRNFVYSLVQKAQKQNFDATDQPLDFSLKSSCETLDLSAKGSGRSTAYEAPVDQIQPSDQPIDLTCKNSGKSNNTEPQTRFLKIWNRSGGCTMLEQINPQNFAEPFKLLTRQINATSGGSVSELASAQLGQNIDSGDRICRVFSSATGQLQCPKCLQIFKNSVEMRSHLRSNCANNIFKCEQCLAVFYKKIDLDEHLKTKHFQLSNAKHSASSIKLEARDKTTSSSASSSFTSSCLLSEQNNNNPSILNANLRHILSDSSMPSVAAAAAVAAVAAASASARASDSDLATVSRILEAATRTNNFPQFFDLTDSRIKSLEASLKNESNASDSPNVVVSEIGKSRNKIIYADSSADEFCETSAALAQQEAGEAHDDLRDVSDGQDSNPDGGSRKKRNSYADSPHKLKCLYCTRAFPWISSLKRHILTHTGQKPYHCPQCPVTFSTKSNRERHMIRKHGLNVHDPATRQLMDRPFKCHLCVFSSFSSSGKLVRHFKSKHPERPIPESLLISIPTMSQDEIASALSRIMPVGSYDKDLNDKASEQNDIEDEDDDDDSLMDESTQADRLADECLSAGGLYPLAPSTSSLSYDSLIASTSTGSQSNLSVRVHQNARSTPDSVASGEGKAINPERDNYNVDKITECWKCWKTFDSRKTLLRHLKEHSIDLPFKCYLCDASFNVRLDSLQHKTAKHATEWVVVQEKNKVGNLPEYAELMDRLVEEALAGKFVSRTHEGLELDLKPESDYAQRKVFCTLCPKRFWSLQDLRRHMRSHTGERPFECDICQARFTLKHSMMRHRRKHTEDPGDTGLVDSDGTVDDDGSVQGEGESKQPLKLMSLQAIARKRRQPALPFNTMAWQKVSMKKTLQFNPDSGLPVATLGSGDASQTLEGESSVLRQPLVTSDLLQNLLGIDDRATIDQILDSPRDAATMLGLVENGSETKVMSVKSEVSL